MKNQNDLIVSIAAIVVALGVIAWSYFSRQMPAQPAAPEQVIVTDAQMPTGSVQFADSLPSGSGAGGAGGATRGVAGAPGSGGARRGGIAGL